MRICKEDFIPHVRNYNPNMTKDYLFKNPATYSIRVTAIKFKIYSAMGILPHKLDITRLIISTKKVKLCWVSFSNARTVN